MGITQNSSNSLQAQINRKGEELAYFERQLAQLQAQLANPFPNTPSQRAFLQSQIAKTQETIAAIEAVQLDLEEKLSQQLAAGPPASSADTVAQAATARDDGATTSASAPAQKVETPDGRIVAKTAAASTNADPPQTTAAGNVDVGTNAATVSINNSQAIPSPLPSGPLPAPSSPFMDPMQRAQFNQLQQSGAGNTSPVNNATQGGVGAASEDSAQPPTNAVRNRLDELYGGASNTIISQDNILDQYVSYTYSLSWYLTDPATYNKLIKSSKRNLDGYYLLVQSGGAPIGNQVPTNVAADPNIQTSGTVGYGRSPFFPLDYYIDNLEFNVTYGGTAAAGGSATFSDLSFTVTEPNGISLLDNLYRAVSDLYIKKNIVKPGTTPNYSAAMYVMVIRFYGYDVDGNLIQPIARKVGSTDNRAAIEKFIPFTITAIDFKVANKLVEYQVKGVSPGTGTGFSTNRGSIPQNFQFQGATVKDILVGSEIQQTASEAAGDQTRNGVPIESSPPGSNNVQDPSQRGQAQLAAIPNNGWGEG